MRTTEMATLLWIPNKSWAMLKIFLNNSSKVDIHYEMGSTKKNEAEMKTNALISTVECCLEHFEDK